MFKTFIFDLDDTLMWNQYNYDRSKIYFLKWLMGVFNNRVPSSLYILTLLDKIDQGMIKNIGFGQQRFPTAFAETYRALCVEGWGEYDPKLAKKAYEIGLRAYDPKEYRKVGLVPGAEIVLNFLRRQKHRLCLLTKGDPEVQTLKVKALGLSSWFEKFDIVGRKDTKLFQRYLRDWEGFQVISVGNSFSSDIEPALEAGCSAIFIPCYTWSVESIEVRNLLTEWKQRFWQIKRMEEVMGVYPQL